MYATHRGSMHLWTTIAHPRSQDRLKGLHPLGHQTPRKPKASILGVVEGSGGPALPSNCHKGGVEGENLTLKEADFGCMQNRHKQVKICIFIG